MSCLTGRQFNYRGARPSLHSEGQHSSIATPHGEIAVPSGSSVWLRAKDNYTLVGSETSGVRISDSAGDVELPKQHIRDLGTATYPWIVGEPWRDDSLTPLGRPLAIDPDTSAWRIELRTIPSDSQSGVRLHGNNQAEALIHLVGNRVSVDGQTYELAGAPLQPRRITIVRLADGRQQLRIDGATGSIPLKLLKAPLYIATEGNMHLDQARLITGIDPRS